MTTDQATPRQAAVGDEGSVLLDVRGLRTSFATESGSVTAVDGVSFAVRRGEMLGVVGESGCGKSVTADSIMRLLDERTTTYDGEVVFDGRDLLALSDAEMRRVRGGEIGMVFQDPMSSLNPVFTIGNQLTEAIRVHTDASPQQARERALEMLARAGVPEPGTRLGQYPHELSGGLRQRVMIAMALSCDPRLLIADEPTTALDVTTQAQILELVHRLRDDTGMAMVLITHDLGVVAETCDRVLVMYLGQVIEDTVVDDLFDEPRHPYTQGLLASVPEIDGDRTQELHVIGGRVPTLREVPDGCRFRERCRYATEQCAAEVPPLEDPGDGHLVRCWNWRDLREREVTEAEAAEAGAAEAGATEAGATETDATEEDR